MSKEELCQTCKEPATVLFEDKLYCMDCFQPCYAQYLKKFERPETFESSARPVPHDFASEIERELDKLIGIGEMLYQMADKDFAGLHINFFFNLSYLISDAADKIKELLEPTYEYFLQGGISGEFARREQQAAN